MDNKKHSITIPFEDYNEFITKEKQFEKMLEHIKLMVKKGLVDMNSIDIEKSPKDVRAVPTYNMIDYQSLGKIKFEY